MNYNKQNLNKNSLANAFTIIENGDGHFAFNLRDALTVSADDMSQDYFMYHTVNVGETYHSISFNYYGTERLWWLIIKFNNIDNPIDFPKAGTTLKILKPAIKNTILNIVQNNG